MTELKSQAMRVAWKVSKKSIDIASVRYRALIPIRSLGFSEYQCSVHAAIQEINLDKIDLLVIVKSLSADDCLLAQEAAKKGIPVVFDLCDNIFTDTYSQNKGLNYHAGIFGSIIANCSAVVVTTEPLAQIVKSLSPKQLSVYIVPDGIDDGNKNAYNDVIKAKHDDLLPEESSFHQLRIQILKQKRFLILLKTYSLKVLLKLTYKKITSSLRRRVFKSNSDRAFVSRLLGSQKKDAFKGKAPAANPEILKEQDDSPNNGMPPKKPRNVRRLLWFGNHGAPHANYGMLDLLKLRELLEKIGQEFNIELVVVSNNQEKYESYIKPFRLKTYYVEWSASRVESLLQDATAVLVPNSLDAFSICKSANRTVHALCRGVPVIATMTPALEPLRECIVTDDDIEGIKSYLHSDARRKADVKRAQSLIDKLYGRESIYNLWSEVIKNVVTSTRDIPKSSPEFIIVLHLIQDLDLALGIIAEAGRQKIELEVWCSASLLKKSPRVVGTLRKNLVNMKVLPDKLELQGIPEFPEGVKAVLAVTETNLGPHRFPRQIILAARQKGLKTGTLQHGFENVGLTYGDEQHPINKVDFVSDQIFIWSEIDKLDAKVDNSTRSRCVTVGWTKTPVVTPIILPGDWVEGETIVGVFENLHWHRYSDSYRNFFLEALDFLALANPAIKFLVKPHHAGMWLTNRYEGSLPSAKNLVIADPKAPEWEAFTAESILNVLSAVITTPSTVALDAAARRLPVAIVSFDLEIEKYRPLSLLNSCHEAQDFINKCLDQKERALLSEISERFYLENVAVGNASEKILKALV